MKGILINWDVIRIIIFIARLPFLISAHQVLAPINKLLDTVEFDSVFYSLDWHPSDHVSFIDNIKKRALHSTSPLDADNAQVYDTVTFAGPPPMKQKLWPRHCVQDSWGSELHKDLKVSQGDSIRFLCKSNFKKLIRELFRELSNADRGERDQGVQRYKSGSGFVFRVLGQ